MTLSSKAEQHLLGHDDWDVVRQSHHPAIHQHSPAELEALRGRLRTLRGRESTLLRQTVRAGRGKAAARGGSFPGNAEHAARRKQVFAHALRRVNSEVSRVRQIEAKEALIAASRSALALREAGIAPDRPANARTANEGARAKPNRRGKSHIPGSQVGSVTKATKAAQAKRDTRES